MLSEQNIEAELSYSYLHAVATRAGFSCEYRNRHLDGAGVDATMTEDGRALATDSILTSFSVDVQLKATYQELPQQDGRISYCLTIPHYDKLRMEEVGAPRILIVLRLPPKADDWLQINEDALVMKRCAYWISLRGAPPSENDRHQTVYIPSTNLLTPSGLTELMTRFSRREVVPYAA